MYFESDVNPSPEPNFHHGALQCKMNGWKHTQVATRSLLTLDSIDYTYLIKLHITVLDLPVQEDDICTHER